MSESSTTHTFWNLIKSCKVIIPKLQRDYAQGRENDQAIEQIRNSLLDEIYSAVVEDKPLVLNFIYGAKGEEKFVPIDGQQRLTTLFLIHWYTFTRTQYTEGLKYLKGFSYETRDTSRRFCENICEAQLDFSKSSIAEQIKECYWLTGNFSMDPTIKSMLVVIDALHRKFNNIVDFEVIKNKLIDDDCPISFLWLEMPNFQQTNDLYIKMNARGKLLSDFEIFKAKLQNSELLDKMLGENNSEKEKILFISKYNNQYAEFFYRLFNDEYDNALMDFIKEMLRDAYMSYVSRCKVPQKTYRSDYGKIRTMNGSIFYRYIENGGTGYTLCNNPEEAFVDGLRRADALLDMFNSMTNILVFENTLKKNYYDEKDLFIKNHSRENLEEDVIRYSLYSFLYKFGIPNNYDQKNAYSMWKRIIYNLVTNSTFEGRREDICEAFVFIENIVSHISACDEASILATLSSIKADSCTAAIRYQMKEEIIKAVLIKDASWKKEILDAELYFIDGQIGFLLEFSLQKDNGSYDIVKFKEYYECLKTIFDSNKKLNTNISYMAFEQAMLCMNDNTVNSTGHLLKQANSTTSWGFVGTNYKELLKNSTDSAKKQIFKEILDRIIIAPDVNVELNSIIASMDESKFEHKSKWKIPFIKNKIFDVFMGDFKFRNCINLENENLEVLLISGTTVRSKSMELNTYLLYQELKKKKIKAKLVLYATGVLKDNEGFPTRYIEINDVNIGYTAEDIQKPYVWKKDGIIEKLSWDGVMQKVNML